MCTHTARPPLPLTAPVSPPLLSAQTSAPHTALQLQHEQSRVGPSSPPFGPLTFYEYNLAGFPSCLSLSAGTQLLGQPQPSLGSGRSPVIFVCFPAGVYPGSITPHNGLASSILPSMHDVPSRHHPLDATTSSHHHLSPLPTAESTRDGYVQQASPPPGQQVGTCTDSR